jgi:hypothetical protein
METNIIKLQPIEVRTGELAKFVEEAQFVSETLVIVDDESNNKALAAVKNIKGYLTQAESIRKGYVAPLNDVVTHINGIFKQFTVEFDKAEDVIKKKMNAYRIEKERVRLEEEKRLKIEHEKAVAKAEKAAEKKGVEFVPPPPPPVLMKETTVRAGDATASFVSKWSAEVTDLKALLQGVIDGKVPMDAIEPNMKFLNAQAKAYKKPDVFAGVKFNEEKTVSVR